MMPRTPLINLSSPACGGATRPRGHEPMRVTSLAASAFLTALLSLLPPAASPVLAQTLVGSWEGRYSCDGRTEGRMTLDLTGEGGQVAGTFRFAHPEGDGAYQVIGREDGAGGFALSPQDWIERPAGMMALTLQGRFKAGGRAIEGALVPCSAGSFVAEPARAADAPPPEIAAAAPLGGGAFAGVWRGGVACSSNRRGKTEVYPIELTLAMDAGGIGGGGILQIYKTRGSGEGPVFLQRFVSGGSVADTTATLRVQPLDSGGAPIQLRAVELVLDPAGRLSGAVRMNGCQTITLDRVGDLPPVAVPQDIQGLWSGASLKVDRPTAYIVQVTGGLAEVQATWPANVPELDRDRLRLSLLPIDLGLGRLLWVPVGEREATGAFRHDNTGGTHFLRMARVMLMASAEGGLAFHAPVQPQELARALAAPGPVLPDGKAMVVILNRPDAEAEQALAAGEAPPLTFDGAIGGELAAAPSREGQCRVLDAWLAPEAEGIDPARLSVDAGIQRLAPALGDERFVPVFGMPFLLTTQRERFSVARFIQSTCRGKVSGPVLFMADFVFMSDNQFARISALAADRRETELWLAATRAALPSMAPTADAEAALGRLRQEAERERKELLPEERQALLAEIDRRSAELRADRMMQDIAALPDTGFMNGDLGLVLRAVEKAADLPPDLAATLREAAATKAHAMLAAPKATAVAVLPDLPVGLEGLRQAEAAMAPLAQWRAPMEAAFGSIDPEGVLRPLHDRIAALWADAGVQQEFASVLSRVEARGDARGAVLAAAAPYIAADDLFRAPELARIVEEAVLDAELRQVRLVDTSVPTAAGEPTINEIAAFVLGRVRDANEEIRRQEEICLSGSFTDPVAALNCLSQPAVWSGQTGQFGVVLLAVEKLGCTAEVAGTRYRCLFTQTIDITLPDGMGIGGIPGLTSGEVQDALFLRMGGDDWRVIWGDLD